MVSEILGKAREVSIKCNRTLQKTGMRFAKSPAGIANLARKKTSRSCRCDELEARLERVEELARANRRELDIQFRRMADLQAEFDSPMAQGRRRESGGKGDGKGNGQSDAKSVGKLKERSANRHRWLSSDDGDGFR
jgi:hypothetical protein